MTPTADESGSSVSQPPRGGFFSPAFEAIWAHAAAVSASVAERDRRATMTEIFAQGDLLIERVRDLPVSGRVVAPVDGVFVLAEGELTGHRHAIHDSVAMFRDDGLACDIPKDLYVAHLKVTGAPVLVDHAEHAPIALSRGTYRVRRQREQEPADVQLVAD